DYFCQVWSRARNHVLF
nr:immunoglobulin light chain junction region [Macaca mulatta]